MHLLDSALQERTLLTDKDPVVVRKNFLFLLFLLDILYLFGAIYQNYLVGGYPDKKLTSHGNIRKFLVFGHIICGSLAIYTGSLFYILARLDIISNSTIFGYILGISQTFHSISNVYMNNFVYGDRRLCRYTFS